MASKESSSERQHHFLECSICHYSKKGRNPKGLHCLHSFCCDCLVGWMKTSGGDSRIECPVCRTVTDLPEDGIPGLPVDFRIEEFHDIFKAFQDPYICQACPPTNSRNFTSFFCRTCDRRLCDDCHKHHVSCQLFSGHEVVPFEHVCSDHGKILSYFCIDCFKGMCFTCQLWRTHEKHDVQNLSDCIAKVKKIFQSDIDDFTSTCENFKRSIAETKADELKKLKDFESSLLSKAKAMIEDVNIKVCEAISRCHYFESEHVKELLTDFEEENLPEDKFCEELHRICELTIEGMASEMPKKREALHGITQQIKNITKDQHPLPSWDDEYIELETVDDISAMLAALNRLVKPTVDTEIGKPVVVLEKTCDINDIGIPSHLEVLSDGSALVSVEEENCVKRFDAKGNIINYYYTDLEDSGRICFTSDDESVYILCEDDSTLVTINLKTSKRTVRNISGTFYSVPRMTFDLVDNYLVLSDAQGHCYLGADSLESYDSSLINGFVRAFRNDEDCRIGVCGEDAVVVYESDETLVQSISYAGEISGKIDDIAYLGNNIILMLSSSSQIITRYDLANKCFMGELLSEDDALAFPFRIASSFPYLWVAGIQSRIVPDDKMRGSLQLFRWIKSTDPNVSKDGIKTN